MSNVLTKDDKSLKQMMKSIFKEMKDDFLQSVFHRIELLESKLYDKDQENDKLKTQIKKLNTDLEEQKSENLTLRGEIDEKSEIMNGKLNDLEQYGRRNNVRIEGMINDKDETPEMTSKLVIDTLNTKIEGLHLTNSDIDAAHRLGKVKFGITRQIIVKFLSRMTRDRLMSQKYRLKNTGNFVNDDLTHIIAKVLACIRKMLPDEVEKGWSQNGRLMYKNKMGHKHTVLFKEYNHWLDIKWPDDKNAEPENDGNHETNAME